MQAGEPKTPVDFSPNAGTLPDASTVSAASAHRFATLHDEAFCHNPVPMWVYDVATLRFLAVNQACCDRYGYDEAELLQRSVLDLRPVETHEVFLRTVREDPTAPARTIQWAHLTRSGQVLEVEVTSAALQLEGVQARLVVAIDITCRKQVEQALKESESRYRLMVEMAGEGVWQVDESFRTVFANERMAQILKTTREAMLGARVQDFFEPSQLAAFMELETKRRQGRSESHDFCFTAADGSKVWALVSAAPMTSPSGEFCGAVAMVTDISVRKQMESDLLASETRFREIAEAIDEVFWMADTGVELNLYVSPAYEKVWGRSRKSLQENPKSFQDAVHPEDRPGMARALEKQARGEVFQHEYRIIRPDGAVRWIFDRGFPIRDARGVVLRFVGSAIDITERRVAELRENSRRSLLENVVSDAPLDRILTDILKNIAGDTPDAWLFLMEVDEAGACRLLGINTPSSEPLGCALAKSFKPAFRSALASVPSHALPGPVLDHLNYDALTALHESGATWLACARMSMGGRSELWLLGLGSQQNRQPDWITRWHGDLQVAYLAISRARSIQQLRELNAKLERRVEDRTLEMQRQAMAMDSSTEGMAILQGEVYVYMNPSHANMYGYDGDELIGLSWKTIYSGEEVQRLQVEAFPPLLASGHWQGETRGKRKDGSEFTTDIILTLTSNGDLVCCCRDTTLRHQQTEALRRSQEQLSLVLSSTNDGFWDLHIPSGNVTYSPRWFEMMGHQQGDLPPSLNAWTKRLHPDDQGWVFREYESFLKGAVDQLSCEYRIQRREGGWMWVLDRAKIAARSAEGVPLRAVGTLSDITARREAEAALRRRTEELIESNAALARAAQGRDEFLARVSHELRTPLASIINLTEIMLEPETGLVNERHCRYLHSISNSSSHLLEVINDVLDVAKLQAGQVKLEIKDVACEDVLNDSLRLVRPQASTKHLPIHINIKTPGLVVRADSLRLKQMLVNLLGNAIKFTPQGGLVSVEILAEADHAVFRVIDTGIGIDRSRLRALFQPFVQVDSGLDRRYEGSGLGLVIVKHFAELHNGSVAVDSERGKGSVFSIRLPLAMAEREVKASSPAPAPAIPLPPSSGSSGLTIMLVDDNELNRTTIADYLHAVGFNVVSAGDGETALRLVEEVLPAMMILDVQMPGLDGLEVARRLRRHLDPRVSKLPVLGLTALAMPEDEEICLRAGMTAYQAKPVPLKTLRHLVEKLSAQGPPSSPS